MKRRRIDLETKLAAVFGNLAEKFIQGPSRIF
jgi:hypothetical protein